MSSIQAAGVVVFRRRPELSFLLMEHPTRLDLPKGHCEEGESLEAAALRELAEETGIARQDVELDPVFRFVTTYPVRSKRYGGREVPKTLTVFLAWLKRDVPIALTEHTGYRWVPWKPPHVVQANTLDPLLAELDAHFAEHPPVD
jgi:bis(5'-nucleosidyl)-tetraphosphatase